MRITALVMIGLLAVAGCDSRESGQAAARRDLDHGKLVVKSYGPGVPSRDRYAAILKEYGIELRIRRNYCFTEWGAESVEGYNEVMYAEIEKLHGTNFLWNLGRETYQKYIDEHPQNK